MDESTDARRFALRWSLVAAALLVAFVGTVIAVNATVYSASGFVRGYLEALSRNDVDAVLRLDGVRPSDGAGDELLAADAIGDLADIRLVDDTVLERGEHVVEFEYSLDGVPASSTFRVSSAGTVFGVFADWRFDASPTATVVITPQNVSQFTANGVTVESPGGPSTPASYNVLVPAALELGHSSSYFEAVPQLATVTEPGSTLEQPVSPSATAEFVGVVQDELDGLLDECVTQQVLQPTGCPFGRTIRDRIEGAPVWSVASYPVITIVPGSVPGTWSVPTTPAAAHLVVDVRSLFDGTVTRLDEDVPFSVAYDIVFGADGGITISAR